MSLNAIRLRYYTDDEIKALAVVKVTNPSSYDRGVPKTDGVNDARMGLIDHTVRCPTCFKANCDQHFGYVDLARPVYRLGSINTVIMILRTVCRECAKPKFKCGLDAEPEGLVAHTIGSPSREKLRVLSEACRNKFTCLWCGAPQPVYSKRERTFVDATYRPRELNSDFVKQRGPEYTSFLKSRYMPDDAASVLHGICTLTQRALGIDRPTSLLCKLQIVPPPIIRPSNFVGETKVRSENDLTVAIQDIVRSNLELKGLIELKAPHESAHDKLQVMVSGLVNHAIKRTAAQNGLLPLVTATSKRKVIDLKCRLNGKKARVRGNLNGKRVDQSGRTVISGDASHDIDELGVPTSMMNKLTFPEMVTSINAHTMVNAVIIGSYSNGGALAVRSPGNSLDHVIWLPILDREARIDLASQLRPGWIVERHLVDGDWVLFNRQPSLWKASMMAFKCYRVDGLTCKLPLPVTRAFNADFDGDEMNIHALQGYEAIAEAQELMGVSHQIVTAQSNSVIIGLVQDSLVGAYRITSQDCFFSYYDALDILSALHYYAPQTKRDESQYRDTSVRSSTFIVPSLKQPAILKAPGAPRGLFTGKQLTSCLLPFTVSFNKNPDFCDMLGTNGLVIKHGQILCGRLAKTHLGASSTGLVYSVWRLYGPGGAHKFISDAQRFFVKHLCHDGPSQSIIDCMMSHESVTLAILAKHLGRSDSVLNLELPEAIKEAKSSAILQETLRSVGASVLSNVRSESALANCVNSGSKGNVMNIAQIGGCVGQQTVYGRRVPLRQTRLGPRTLIYYAPGDLRAEARGFISNSYMSGLSPAEFFEHQMAGREGIVATAVNTSESGYNQRRMIKGQESQCLGYDGTVRVSSNVIIQTSYGGDDLDGSRLERIKLTWLFTDLYHIKSIFFEKALEAARKYVIWRANTLKDLDLQVPCGISVGPLITSKPDDEEASFDQVASHVLSVHARHHSAKKALMNISVACLLLQCAERWPISKVDLQTITKLYTKAIVNPGEGVGPLGATCIGEPSMQMTLNVFHYAGISDKNVTITGLPRFKQLINGVDTYETANMSAALRDFTNVDEALQISTVRLSEILNGIPEYKLVEAHEGFGLFNGMRGPLSTKFSCDESNVSIKITLFLSWPQCARRNIKTQAVVKALRDTLSFDAILCAGPHSYGTSKGPMIEIFLAPWIKASCASAIVEALCTQQQVRGLDYIKNSIVFQEKQWTLDGQAHSRHIVETEGSNMVDLAKCPFLVPESIKSSNVVEVATFLGISAGLVVLQSELHKVLSFDSAYIDSRHTWLLADTMGRSGVLSAMNRHHMELLGSSLLQRASFEQSLDVFEEGATFGLSDNLAGATERIITGQPVCMGTGLVGVVSSYTSEESEILVGPMLQDAVDVDGLNDEVMVRPLNYKPDKLFDPNVFSTKLTDAPKISTNEFLESCSTAFRTSAASRRAIPNMLIRGKLTDSAYKSAIAACWDYAYWTTKETSELVTEVVWTHKTMSGLTIMRPNQEPMSFHLELFQSDTSSDRLACEIYLRKPIERSNVPFGVESKSVTKRQQSKFTKGPFSLTLARQWTAATNTEAEALLLKTSGMPLAILETAEPEQILQNRCTDAQLGNAMYARLP
jgi:DNA-directed RNA polymerase II subunit RPB1